MEFCDRDQGQLIVGVDLERLPLRLDRSGLSLSGYLDADADVALDPLGL